MSRWVILFFALVLAPGLRADPPKLTPRQLEKEIAARRLRVPELEEISRMAAKRGLRAYLFGGTAAGVAHYVKWDALREKGDPRFQPQRFDYDYLSIFRSNQDIDLVVTRADGSAESEGEIDALQAEISKRFPYLQGEKSRWEVRGLKTAHGGKEALLGDADFAAQHTDSQSTGLIELTEPPRGEPLVRDLRDWESRTPAFLEDAAADRIRYYHSRTHDRTARALRGDNPSVISAIRCLTKAFQYDLEIDAKSMKQIQRIIDDFQPAAKQTRYVRQWIERNAKKLLQNAASLERAWNTLEKTGLRKKLIEFSGNPGNADSLAWWLSKEPLRLAPSEAGHDYRNGRWRETRGKGRTARELGIDVVAHSALDYEVYESILRSPRGVPNALVSREGHTDERAVYGDGFYTQVGEEGAWSRGFHIRFRVDPSAREGKDFVVIDEGGGPRWVLWKTADKLTAIPDSMTLTVPEILSFILDDKVRRNASLHHKLIRKLQMHNPKWQADELESALRSMWVDGLLPIFLPSPDVEGAKHLIEVFGDVGGSTFDALALSDLLPQKVWAKHENGEFWLSRTIMSADHDFTFADLELLLTESPAWKNHPRRDEHLLHMFVAQQLDAQKERSKGKLSPALEKLFRGFPVQNGKTAELLGVYLATAGRNEVSFRVLRKLRGNAEWRRRLEDSDFIAKVLAAGGREAKKALGKENLLPGDPCRGGMSELSD